MGAVNHQKMNHIIREDIEQIVNSSLQWSLLEDKTVLISGGNGFLPAYMIEVMLFLNKNVFRKKTKIVTIVRDIQKTKNKFSHHNNIENDVTFLVQDVNDPISIDGNIDYIIHAASQASPKFYNVDPIGTLSANVLGTLNLLTVAKKCATKIFLYFSSSEVYGIVEDAKQPIKESNYGYLDPLQIRSCYAESKRMGENICISWMHQYGLPIKIIRPFHIYGPGMSLDDGRVYADFVSDIVHGRNIIMKSEGLSKRSFCYLADSTVAFFKVLFDGVNGEAYNVGNSKQEISIINLANKLISFFPERNIEVEKYKSKDKSYLQSTVQRINPDLQKINELGWFAKTSIDEGFLRTIKSYE